MRVFLAHSSEDKPAVRELYQRLKADGFEPWLDEENLLAGQVWDLQITRAIRTSDVVVVILSRQSTGRFGYVNREIRTALEVAAELPDDTVFVIPARLEPTEVPAGIGQLQFVDLYDQDGYARLVQALRRDGRAVGDHAVARDFEYTGLVDVDGWPLDRSSPQRSQLILDVCDVNARLLRDLREDPKRL